jgi:hypothetical protein
MMGNSAMLRPTMIAAVFAGLVASFGTAQSAVLINAFEENGNVQFTANGSLDIGGMSVFVTSISITPGSGVN